MKNISPKIILMVAVGLFFCAWLYADTITLWNGKDIEGRIYDKTDDTLTIYNENGTLITYFNNQVRAIDGVPYRQTTNLDTFIPQEAPEVSKTASLQSYISLGIQARMSGKQKEAIEDFSKAIEVDTSYADAYNNRGISYASDDVAQYSNALSDFSTAISLSPDEGEYYLQRAKVYFKMDDYTKSWVDVHKAMDLGYDVWPDFLAELKAKSGRQN